MQTSTENRPKKPATRRAAAPSTDAIAYRAYELYLQRGGDGGSEMDDWLAAEKELATPKPAKKIKAA